MRAASFSMVPRSIPHDTLAAQKLGIGTVYQEVNLLANLSVAENLFLGRQPRRFGMISSRVMNKMANDLLSHNTA